MRVYVAVVDGSSASSDADRELNDLRARAYGPDPDIDTDPAAHARLVELEAAHLATWAAVPAAVDVVADKAEPTAEPPSDMHPVTPSEGDRGSPWHPATATRGRRLWILAGSILVVVMLISALTWLLGPQPDATQHPIAVETEFQPAGVMVGQGVNADSSTIRQYEAYRDIKLWSLTDDRGYSCLVAYEQGLSGRFQFQCVPPGTELFVDLAADPEGGDAFGEWLPDDGFVRFQLRGAGVDVYLPPA